jgi:hypothetical protein
LCPEQGRGVIVPGGLSPDGSPCIPCSTALSSRRFLLHVLPSGFHRIRHCGLFPERFEPATSIASATSFG